MKYFNSSLFTNLSIHSVKMTFHVLKTQLKISIMLMHFGFVVDKSVLLQSILLITFVITSN